MDWFSGIPYITIIEGKNSADPCKKYIYSHCWMIIVRTINSPNTAINNHTKLGNWINTVVDVVIIIVFSPIPKFPKKCI